MTVVVVVQWNANKDHWLMGGGCVWEKEALFESSHHCYYNNSQRGGVREKEIGTQQKKA